MKFKNLKFLLIVPLLSIVAACTDPKVSSSNQSSVEPSVEPSDDPSVEPSVDPSVEPSDASSTAPENPAVKVNSYQKIYLVDQSVVVHEVLQYSNTLQSYSPATNYTVESIDMSTPGTKTVKVYVGNRFAEIEIEVYENAASAAAAYSIYDPATVETYFNESDYVNKTTNNPKVEVYYEIDEETETKVFKKYVGRTSKISSVNTEQGIAIWTFDVPTGVTALPVPAIIDPTRYTTPHQFDFERDETGAVVKDENGNNVLSTTEYLTCSTYAKWRVEMILDSEGRIALLQRCMPDNAWTASSGHVETDLWFSNSVYENNDENPALIFGENYDISTDVGREKYEKVIPEGGHYVILDTESFVTSIWNKLVTDPSLEISGSYSATTEIEQENNFKVFNQSNRGKDLDKARVKWDSGAQRLRVFQDAELGFAYAYYYTMVLRNEAREWDTFEADREAIIKAIVEENNPLIAVEPVLANYYSSLSTDLIEAFGEKVEANLVA